MATNDGTRTAERLIDTNEVASRLHIHPKTLITLLRKGDSRIPNPLATSLGNGLRWRESAVDEHIRGLE